MWLTRFAISRPVITAMVFIALGDFWARSRSSNSAAARIRRTRTSRSSSSVRVIPAPRRKTWNGWSSSRSKIRCDGIDNLDQMTATAQEGTAAVVVQFKLGTDLDFAAIDVQRRAIRRASTCRPIWIRPTSRRTGVGTAAARHRGQFQFALADGARRSGEQLKSNRCSSRFPNVQTVDVYGAADARVPRRSRIRRA